MRTEPRQLHGQSFDLLIVGAGIQGAAIAREAALRGLTVALVDARDIAAGTSSRSSRLVHGGLRYLQHGHFALVREALHERERLLRLAPHLVRPVPMLMPIFRGAGSGLLPWLGTHLYSLLAGRSTLPRPRRLAAAAAVGMFPGLRTDGLLSAVLFFDAATDDARLTLANVEAAAAAGARVATHCRVLGATGDGARLACALSGDEIEVRARNVINAGGPAVDAVRRALGVEGAALCRQSRGSHVVLPPRPGEVALAAFLPDRRIQFVIPHVGGTLCGTTDVEDPLAGDEVGPPMADLEYLEQALAHLLAPPPARCDLWHAYAGWRALPVAKGPPGALHREAFTVTEAYRGGTLHSVVGGKLTTHRSFAERTMARLFGLRKASVTRVSPLPGGDGPCEPSDPLWRRWGSLAPAIHRLGRTLGVGDELLCPHRPFLVAEAVHALRATGVVRFADLLLRRLSHPLGPCTEPGCLLRAHSWFLRERGPAVDGGFEAAAAAVLAEVDVLVGDLPAFRGGSRIGVAAGS